MCFAVKFSAVKIKATAYDDVVDPMAILSQTVTISPQRQDWLLAQSLKHKVARNGNLAEGEPNNGPGLCSLLFSPPPALSLRVNRSPTWKGVVCNLVAGVWVSGSIPHTIPVLCWLWGFEAQFTQRRFCVGDSEEKSNFAIQHRHDLPLNLAILDSD